MNNIHIQKTEEKIMTFSELYVGQKASVQKTFTDADLRAFAEVKDVVNGKTLGRENDEERILAYNIGISIHDISFAAKIYDLMHQNTELFNAIPDVDMENPTEKFWI